MVEKIGGQREIPRAQLRKEEDLKIDPWEILKDKNERRKVSQALSAIKNIIVALKADEKGDWERFFKAHNLGDIRNVLDIMSKFQSILGRDKVRPLEVVGQIPNISKVTKNFSAIRKKLQEEKGIDILELAA